VEAFFINHGAGCGSGSGGRLEAVKFLWKQKHFKERSWKQKSKLGSD